MSGPDRVAIITGGGTGIGAAAAIEFSNRRTAVALVGRRLSPLEDCVKTIREEGGEAIAIPADLADPGSPKMIVDAVTGEWSRIDVVVNNAAATQHLPIEEATLDL